MDKVLWFKNEAGELVRCLKRTCPKLTAFDARDTLGFASLLAMVDQQHQCVPGPSLRAGVGDLLGTSFLVPSSACLADTAEAAVNPTLLLLQAL